jgi:mRNA interferase MazF
MKKGDVILIDFPFTDLSGSKLRPGLVLTVEGENTITAFFTTTLKTRYNSDQLIMKNDLNGLKKDSILRLNKITTIDNNLIKGKFGELSPAEIHEINKKIITLFDLNTSNKI